MIKIPILEAGHGGNILDLPEAYNFLKIRQFPEYERQV